MGLLADGEAWLRARRAGEARQVTYRRGSDSAELAAVQAQTVAEVTDGQMIVEAATVDWLIERADLVLDSVPVEPESGDKIEVAYAHGTERYLVASMGAEPCWRWHGRDGGTFRVHSVRV